MQRSCAAVLLLVACGSPPPGATTESSAVVPPALRRTVERSLLAHECRVRGLLRADEVLVDVANDATFVLARLATPGEHDVVLPRGPYARSVASTLDPELARNLTGSCVDEELLHDPASDVFFDGPRIQELQVSADPAEVHATATIAHGRDLSAVRVRWRRVRGGLEMAEHRAWPLVRHVGSSNVVFRFSPAKWHELDAEVERREREGPPACHLDALLHAQRFREVLDAVEALPAPRRAAYAPFYRSAARALAELDRGRAFEDEQSARHGVAYADLVMFGANDELDECDPPGASELD